MPEPGGDVKWPRVAKKGRLVYKIYPARGSFAPEGGKEP
jgi:hypothetical protein